MVRVVLSVSFLLATAAVVVQQVGALAAPAPVPSTAVVGYTANNTLSPSGRNATTNVFRTDEFFDAMVEPCRRFSDRLEACPTDPIAVSRDRFATAQLFAECLARQYGDYFFCSKPFEKLKFLPVQAFPAMYNTKNYTDAWRNATLPDFPTQNGTCRRPDVVTIMRQACAFDYDTLNGNDCCSNPQGKEPCGKESFNLLACSIQTMHTYVGCTARTPLPTDDPAVAPCVTATAPRINYVPIGFQINSNGNACPAPHETIMALARWSVIEFLVFVLANGGFWARFIKRRCLGRGKGEEELRDRKFAVNMLGFWSSLALEIGEIVIVGTLLSRRGYQVDMLKEFVIWAVRPRSAFLNGVLGAIDAGWTHDAVTDMMAHILLSVFGGYLAFFGALSANHTKDPARPGEWKTYMVGGFMASVSTDVIWVAFSIGCVMATFCCWKAMAPGFRLMFRVLWFALSAPLIQAKVFLKNLYLRLRRRGDEREEYLVLRLGDQPLMGYYYAALALCLVLFVGNWMFWTGFLELSGELFCPGSLAQLDVVIIGLIFARNVVRGVIGGV